MVDSDFAMGGMLGLIDFDDPIAYPAKHWLDGAEWAHNRSVVQEAEDLYGTGLFLTVESDRREWAWEVDRLFMEDASMNVMWWAIRRDHPPRLREGLDRAPRRLGHQRPR